MSDGGSMRGGGGTPRGGAFYAVPTIVLLLCENYRALRHDVRPDLLVFGGISPCCLLKMKMHVPLGGRGGNSAPGGSSNMPQYGGKPDFSDIPRVKSASALLEQREQDGTGTYQSIPSQCFVIFFTSKHPIF